VSENRLKNVSQRKDGGSILLDERKDTARMREHILFYRPYASFTTPQISLLSAAGGHLRRIDRATRERYELQQTKIIPRLRCCNPGEFVLGGGFTIMTPAYQNPLGVTYSLDKYFVCESYPSSATSWTASFLNRMGPGQGSVLAAYVHGECASGLSTSVNVISSAGVIGSNVSATSSPGSVSGGGFQVKSVHGNNDG
jgi:hypothetical protein